MDGLPFQLPTQKGTELFPDQMQAPPIMTIAISEPDSVKVPQKDPLQGDADNSYGMADGKSPKQPGDHVPENAGDLKAEAIQAALKLVEGASGEIRGWYLGQRHNASLSTTWMSTTSKGFSWGSARFVKAMGTEHLDITVSASAINKELKKTHDFYDALLAVQFEDEAAG